MFIDDSIPDIKIVSGMVSPTMMVGMSRGQQEERQLTNKQRKKQLRKIKARELMIPVQKLFWNGDTLFLRKDGKEVPISEVNTN